MGITLKKMQANTASVQIAVGEDTVTVTYYPAKVTEKVLAEINVLADAQATDPMQNLAALNAILVALVASWDVLDDDGAPLPITDDVLTEVPFTFRSQVVNAVFEDIQGNATAARAKN